MSREQQQLTELTNAFFKWWFWYIQSGGGTSQNIIVDDEPTIRDASKIILENLGYTVVTAENGEEGVSLYTAHKDTIQLVITDFSMPRKNGGRLSHDIHEVNADLPILLCTGYSETLELQRISTSNFAAILHKPLQRPVLAKVVRNLIDGRAIQDSVIPTPTDESLL